MARGQQKLQSQAKAAEKAAKMKKQQGHNANTQKKAAQKALVFICVVCKVSYQVARLTPSSFTDDRSIRSHTLRYLRFHRLKCQILKLTSNISKTNIQRMTCLMN